MSAHFEPLINHVWVAICPRCGAESRWLCLGDGECPDCHRPFVRVSDYYRASFWDVPVAVARRIGA